MGCGIPDLVRVFSCPRRPPVWPGPGPGSRGGEDAAPAQSARPSRGADLPTTLHHCMGVALQDFAFNRHPISPSLLTNKADSRRPGSWARSFGTWRAVGHPRGGARGACLHKPLTLLVSEAARLLRALIPPHVPALFRHSAPVVVGPFHPSGARAPSMALARFRRSSAGSPSARRAKCIFR